MLRIVPRMCLDFNISLKCTPQVETRYDISMKISFRGLADPLEGSRDHSVRLAVLEVYRGVEGT